ncbi:type IV pilus assembly protein PilM [Anaerohalosphaera lusitana]|uniref:Type IV pilus assembly protein PilM n=1 Tax=Anaerohalosphaera lusitana TaxID=1936003 RepID=A0A1U9NPX4_9BACT|nr:pilus assembly protein PilM [Anaerohalosphaera lusitana]AQT69768.1 type IV pilus assembly protein PilM [Anaerohalosphaera lusitana]
MLGSSTYLGIDISQTQVSIAHIKKVDDGIRLLKAGSAPVPEGVVKEQSIEDPRVLAKTVRGLLKKHGVRERKAVVSLFAGAGLAQIIDLPEDVPANVAGYVRSQIKNSALLSGKQSHYDFCRLANARSGSSGRVLVGATNAERINRLLKTIRLAKVEPVGVEFPTIAWCRSIYQKVIKPRYSQNVLAVHVRDSQIFFCVFHKHELDFARCVDVNREEGADAVEQCVNEISSIIQYYELDSSLDMRAGWEVIINAGKGCLDGAALRDSLDESLDVNTFLCSDSSFASDTPAQSSKVESASLTAIGLAMKYAHRSICDLEINLVPERDRDIAKLKDVGLKVGNCTAAMLLAMILFSGYQVAQTNETHRAMEERREKSPSADIEKLVRRHRFLNDHLGVLQEKEQAMNEAMKASRTPAYAKILEEISEHTPQNLCITSLYCDDDDTMIIKGDSLDYQSVHYFARLLQESSLFETAAVAETNKHERIKNLLSYRMECKISGREGLQANASE